MKIFAYSSKNIQFGYRLPKEPINSVKEIKNLPCACCGRNLLSEPQKDELIKNTTLGSSASLKKEEVLAYKNSTGAYEYLASLAKKHPKTPLYCLVKEKKIADKISTMDSETRKEIKEITALTSHMSTNPKQILKGLDKITPYLNEEYQATIRAMRVLTSIYQNESFSEIFNKEEVQNYNKNLANNKKDKNNKKIENIFCNIDKTAQKLPQIQKDILAETNKLAREILYSNKQKKQKEYRIYQLYNPFLKRIKDPKTRQELATLIQNLPSRSKNRYEIMLGFKDYSEEQIIQNFLTEAFSTYEHITPESQGGKKTSSNGIYLCKECNQTRGASSYKDFVEAFPEFRQNMQKQLNKIITYLHHNLLKIEGNCEIKRDYPGIIKNKIQTETSGRVKLNTSKHDRFRLKALKDEKRKLEEKLANNIKKLEEMEMRSNGGALERKNYNIARNKLGREIETIKSRLEIIDFEFTRFRRKIKKGNAYERSKNEHYPKNIDDLI